MNIVDKAELFAKERYLANDPIHQWRHIQNVMERALLIAQNFDDIDYETLKLAVIFHDIDYRSYDTHVDASAKVAEKFLSENNYPRERINRVKEVIFDHSTPHREKQGEAESLEGKIIYDADKSIFITDKKTYDKYYPKLYLKETKNLVVIYK
ncbi:MAG: HD domain-containing protein [Candidatus Paceibacterota bacterium]|jgi:HD superfamily phosphodiesterase